MELLLTGGRLDAQRALNFGFINRIVPQDSLIDEATAIAEKICENGPLAVRAAKESAVRTDGLPLSQAFELDFRIVAGAFASEDAQEGPRAFRERRPPRYQGK